MTDGPAPPTGPRAPGGFHLLAKPTGAQCNLDCAYCFFLSKEMLYPDSRFRMSEETLDSYLRQLIASHAGLPEVTVAWQGGEPTLMGLDFFRRSVGIAERHLEPGQKALHTMQTNATLIDAEWATFLAEHEFLVGVSIDGPEEVHDAYRVTRGGRGSFRQVMDGLGHLRDAGVEWNALTTIQAANAARGREVYRFLRDPDRRLRGVGPPRRRGGVRPDVRRRARQLGRRAARALHPLRDLREGTRPGAHGRRLQLRPLRRAGPPARQHRRPAHGSGRRARAGAVPKDRSIRTPDGEAGLNYLCAGYKAFFHHVDGPMREMSALLARGRAPSEIVERSRRRDAARGRNDPCPCGGGRKWKRCHGGDPPPAA